MSDLATAGAAADARPAPRAAGMGALVSAELLKLRTTRTAFGFLTATVLLTLLIQVIGFATADINSKTDLQETLSGAGIASVLLLILGIVATTGEYRHRTITGSLLATPDRHRYLISKLLAYLIAGAFLGAVATAVTLIVGIPWLAARDQPTDLLSTGGFALVIVRGVAAAAISGAIGVGLGAIVRNQVAAVVGILVYLFMLEPAVGLASEEVLKFTLGQSQSGLLGAGGVGDTLPGGWAGLVYLGWALLLGTIGVLLEDRRDVT